MPTVWCNSAGFGGIVPFAITAASSTYNNLTNWPSTANRPTFNVATNTLTWIGPIGGGPSTSSDVLQTRVLSTSGTITVTSCQVVEGMAITGLVQAGSSNVINVIVRQCYIDAGSGFGVDANANNNLYGWLVEDCCIVGDGTGTVAPIEIGPGTVRRNNLSGNENGLTCQGALSSNPLLVIDNFIWNLGPTSGGAGIHHIDGIGVQDARSGGPQNTTIQHNQVWSWDTSCIFIKADFDNINGVVVDNNLCLNNTAGGTGRGGYAYALYNINGASFTTTNSVITNNILQKGGNVAYTSVDAGTWATWSGNTAYDDGHTLNPGSS